MGRGLPPERVVLIDFVISDRTVYLTTESIMNRKAVILLTIALPFGLLACGESELHEAMEGMGEAYKSMKDAESADSIKADLAVFKSRLAVARQQQVEPEDQLAFDEGLNKAEVLADDISMALEKGDLAHAKVLLADLRDLRKRYHEKLEVK